MASTNPARSRSFQVAGGQGSGGYKSEDSEHSRHSSSSSFEMSAMHSDDDVEDDEETGLTHTERKERRRRKHNKTHLDERFAGSDAAWKAEESKIARATMLKNIIINTILVGLWYTFSISISVYNKWMFSAEKGLDFKFPLFVTSIHMLVQFSLASTVLYFIPRFRPGYNADEAEYTRLDGVDNEGLPSQLGPKEQQPLMTWWFYLTRIAPCGTATALDIGLGNFSLEFITLTFYTMCKSSVLAFVLLFAFIFRLESPTWRLCTIIFFMTVGVVLMVSGELDFNATGFALVMSASFCSGFRWSLTQILLLRNKATSNPFSSIFFLTPVMFIALFFLALPIEGPMKIIAGVKDLANNQGGFISFILILFPGTLAFSMVSAEFALLQRSSVVTLSVCGIFKEVLTISAAGIIFGDELSPINVSGLIVTILSIAAYNYLKLSKMKRDAADEAKETLGGDRVVGGGHDPEGAPRSIAGASHDAREDEDNIDSSTALMRADLQLVTDLSDGDGRGNEALLTPARSPFKRSRDIE